MKMKSMQFTSKWMGISLIFYLQFIIANINAQTSNEYLRLSNVRQFGSQVSSIDTLLFEIKPKGLVTEVSMYFDFSTRGVDFENQDSLEVQMMFKLPLNAEVTDMCLWIEDSMVQARIMDRWTAFQIYEEIVARRTDPAILYKERSYNWNTNSYVYSDLYSFRIFPLMNNLPRKAKITYIIPNSNINSGNLFLSLPINILKISNLPISSMKIRFFPNSNFISPSLIENNDVDFVSNGLYDEADITNLQDFSYLTLRAVNQNNDVILGLYPNSTDNEKYYQLQLIPNQIFGLSKTKKILFLCDYLTINQNSINDFLGLLKYSIQAQLQPTDSFNIALSGFGSTFASNHWIAADSLSIENAFANISFQNFSSVSYLQNVLLDGIDFIQQNGNAGNITLISNSSSNGSFNQANSLINQCLSMMGEDVLPIHIIDLYESYGQYYYQNGIVYYGNDYLYFNIGIQTGGEYFSIKSNGSFSEMLNSVFQYTSGHFINYDLYVTTETGYTYGNYNSVSQGSIVFYNQAIQRFGKYSGSGRFNIILSAQNYNGEIFQSQFFVEESEMLTLDSIARNAWAAKYIKEQFILPQSNSIISSIIQKSIEERVLCDYTAFLALEPDYVPPTNEGQINDLEENLENIKYKVYPNPACDFVVISIDLEKDALVTVEIYDITGRLIDTRNNVAFSGLTNYRMDISEIPSGMYICNIKINGKSIGKSKLSVLK